MTVPRDPEARLVALVYELLDAHEDTARLARRLAAADPEWREHLDYLRRLQRVGREMLAASEKVTAR